MCVSRIEYVKEILLRSRWDLVIVDEAHKMAAYSADKKTLAYKLGEALSAMTDHYLLMTPHKGDPENFCLFLELLDRDIYGSVKSLEEAMRRHHAPASIASSVNQTVRQPRCRRAASYSPQFVTRHPGCSMWQQRSALNL